MSNQTATAISCSNIAFIKYWGNRDSTLRIPTNGSISMNLEGIYTKTKVLFDSSYLSDQLRINDVEQHGETVERVRLFMNRIRQMAGFQQYAQIESWNNFPTGAGLASSASAFSALSLAASSASGLSLNPKELSILARTGSGSACRSIPAGFVEWFPGDSHTSSFAESFAPQDHWDLIDHITIIDPSHKLVVSSSGHRFADTSILQNARVADAPRRLRQCREAILKKDFQSFAQVVELDSNLMHAIMMTSSPALYYWGNGTLDIIYSVLSWRKEGFACCSTIDAGPNVHIISLSKDSEIIRRKLEEIPGVKQVLVAPTGGPARLI